MVYITFQRCQTHARGGVTAGAEDQARIQAQGQPPILGDRLPLRYHDQLLADLDGLVELAPVVLPVAVLHHGDGDLAVGGADGAQGLLSLRIVGQVALDAADAGKLLRQLVVHVVPILVVVLQKVLKIGLVFDHEAAYAHGGHFLAAAVDLLVRGVHGHFDVSHGFFSLSVRFSHIIANRSPPRQSGAERAFSPSARRQLSVK